MFSRLPLRALRAATRGVRALAEREREIFLSLSVYVALTYVYIPGGGLLTFFCEDVKLSKRGVLGRKGKSGRRARASRGISKDARWPAAHSSVFNSRLRHQDTGIREETVS